MLAADASHLYAHLDSGRIFPLTYNVEEVVEGYVTLKKLASSPDHVVPGHDPLVLARNPFLAELRRAKAQSVAEEKDKK